MGYKLLKLSERGKIEMQGLMPDDKVVERLAGYFQNFSDQTRLKILSALSMSELCVNDLSRILNANQTTISHQLKSLKEQNIVDCKRDGKVITYFLNSSAVNELMMFAIKVIS